MIFFSACSSAISFPVKSVTLVIVVGILLGKVVETDGDCDDVLVGSEVTTIGEADGNIVGSNVAGVRSSVGLSVIVVGISVSSTNPSTSVPPSSLASSDVVNTNSHSFFARTPSQSLPPSLFVAVLPPPSTYCPPPVLPPDVKSKGAESDEMI